jgi:hypothetical protein
MLISGSFASSESFTISSKPMKAKNISIDHKHQSQGFHSGQDDGQPCGMSDAEEEDQEPSKGLIWKIIYLSSFQGGLLKAISLEKRNQLQ